MPVVGLLPSTGTTCRPVRTSRAPSSTRLKLTAKGTFTPTGNATRSVATRPAASRARSPRRRHGWPRDDRAAVGVGQSVDRLIEWTIGRSGRRGRFGQVDREPLLQSSDIHRSGSTASARHDRDRPTRSLRRERRDVLTERIAGRDSACETFRSPARYTEVVKRDRRPGRRRAAEREQPDLEVA